MRHVLQGVEVLVLGRHFDAAAPTAAAVEIQAAGVRDLGAINHELVVVETFILGSRDAEPRAVIALGQGVFGATQEVKRHALGLWRNNACADPPFRINLGVLFAGLIEHRRLKIFHRFVCLGQCRNGRQDCETQNFGFHDDC